MRRNREFWQALVTEVDRGERVGDVAQRHRVEPRTLSWWRWKLRSEERPAPRLLPVVVTESLEIGPTGIEMQVRDVRIRFTCGADVDYLAALVEAVRDRCSA